MNSQKGQSMIEFALVVPLFLMICFAMLYGGILFMDYLQFSNAAQAVARQISITSDENTRQTLANDFKNHTGAYFKQMTNLYKADANVVYNTLTTKNVVVTINLTLDSTGLPKVLTWIKFPPEKLKPIEVVVPIEKTEQNDSQ